MTVPYARTRNGPAAGPRRAPAPGARGHGDFWRRVGAGSRDGAGWIATAVSAVESEPTIADQADRPVRVCGTVYGVALHGIQTVIHMAWYTTDAGGGLPTAVTSNEQRNLWRLAPRPGNSQASPKQYGFTLCSGSLSAAAAKRARLPACRLRHSPHSAP